MSNLPTLRPLSRFFASFNLLVALLQLVLFPAVSSGRNLDLLGQLHADALSITFGVAWTLLLAAAAWLEKDSAGGDRALLSWEPFCIEAGLLLVAYAGNQGVLALGMSIVGAGTWQALRTMGSTQSKSVLRDVLLGVALLTATILLSGKVRAFIPPAGGIAEPWSWWVAASVVLSIAASTGCFHLFANAEVAGTGWRVGGSIRGIYALASPYVLAKMLVGGAWDPAAAWVIVLGGMSIMLIAAYRVFIAEGEQQWTAALISGAAVVGVGLGSQTAIAAGGAIWLMLTGLLCILPMRSAVSRAAALIAVVPGVWLITQGALSTGYSVVAVSVLPACVLALLWPVQRSDRAARKTPRLAHIVMLTSTALAVLVAIYPPAVMEWVVKPAVTAMAGGVGTLQAVQTDWGLGVALRSTQETLQAGLPMTGLGVGVLLTASLLYWLKQLIEYFARIGGQGE